MAKQWAKISRDVKDSDRMTALLAKNPLAEALFWRIKAMADDFGRYVGEPEQIAAGVCPRNIIGGSVKLTKFKQALTDMEACSVVRFYTAEDGKRYLEIVDYHSHAHEQWTSTGKPEYPAPPDWTPPDSLVEWIMSSIKNPKATNVTPERFGITPEVWPVGIKYPWLHYTQATPLPMGVPTPLPHPLPGGTDVDSDVDTDSDLDGGAEPSRSPHIRQAETDAYQQGLSIYCQALRTTDGDPAAEQTFSGVAVAYGDEAARDAAIITLQTFSAEPAKPRAGSVSSYLLQTARTQAEKIAAQPRASPLEKEFERHKGPRPSDAMMGKIWDMDLEDYVKTHGTPAA